MFCWGQPQVQRRLGALLGLWTQDGHLRVILVHPWYDHRSGNAGRQASISVVHPLGRLKVRRENNTIDSRSFALPKFHNSMDLV